MRNAYNVAHGAIVALNNESPAHVENPPPKDQLVPLRSWSDIVFLEWLNQCDPINKEPEKAKSLKHVFRNNIINSETEGTVIKASGGHINDVGNYDNAKVFDMPSDEALAMLGTPNGLGVAYLLAQHKDSIGKQKTVTRIKAWDTTFDSPGEREFTGGIATSLIFTIGDQEGAAGPAMT